MTDATTTIAPAEADEVPRGYWKNATGDLVPVSKIKAVDKARDALVKSIAESAKEMSEMLLTFKNAVMDEIEGFVATSAADYGHQMRGALGKGNITLTSFDGRYKVERQVADRIAFDERLQVAKTIIDECVHRWSKGANHNIQALVNHAFRVDKAGNVSVSAVLALRPLKVDDPQWTQAMRAIADSMQAVASVQYVRIYERNAAGAYVAISLNTATV